MRLLALTLGFLENQPCGPTRGITPHIKSPRVEVRTHLSRVFMTRTGFLTQAS